MTAMFSGVEKSPKKKGGGSIVSGQNSPSGNKRHLHGKSYTNLNYHRVLYDSGAPAVHGALPPFLYRGAYKLYNVKMKYHNYNLRYRHPDLWSASAADIHSH